MKRILLWTGRIVLWSLALYGAMLGGAHLLLSLNLTKESGIVDSSSDYFNELHKKYAASEAVDSAAIRQIRFNVLDRIQVLSVVRPINANLILEAYMESGNERMALRMLDAAERYLLNDPQQQQLREQQSPIQEARRQNDTVQSLYEWMNIEEWNYLKVGIRRHKRWIDSAAHASGVEARMIVSCLVGEQVRKFNTRREMYKDMVAPLKSLSFSTMFSYGVTGIKEHTAAAIERHLKDTSSVYYLGPEYEHLLDYDTTARYANKYNDTLSVRVQRLTQPHNHYYSYLYTALFIKQVMKQWERKGFPINDRPEILATIFNLGFAKSVPKQSPEVGGAVFNVRSTQYTFGSIAYEFYYSGDMLKEFPYSRETPMAMQSSVQ